MLLFFIAVVSIISIALGGLFAIRMRDKLHLILGFSAGCVVGIALFDLLPETVKTRTDLTFPLIAVGFVAYLIVDRFFSIHSHGEEECHRSEHDGRIGAAAFFLHCLIDGLAIGLAFRMSGPIGWSVTIAVLAHQFSDGINVVNIIMRDGQSVRRSTIGLLLTAIAPAIGIMISMIGPFGGLLPWVLPLFVGSFLYVGCSDLLPEAHHEHPMIWTTVTSIIGMAFIYVVTTVSHI